jgi:hypothetical protein
MHDASLPESKLAKTSAPVPELEGINERAPNGHQTLDRDAQGTTGQRLATLTR